MKVLITGAGGYLGKGIYLPFEEHGYDLRLMDVVDFDPHGHEKLVADVADLEIVRKAVGGVDAIVIAHMAGRREGAYQTPTVPFDANVKGTANLFFAAVENGIKRVVLVSSTGVVAGHAKETFLTRDLPLKSRSIYGLTKVCQEVIAEQFQREHGMAVAALRVGCIMDADTMVDKYGRVHARRGVSLIDRRDIGDVARLCIELPDLEWEVFYLYGTPEGPQYLDMDYTCERLHWKPKYHFSWLPA